VNVLALDSSTTTVGVAILCDGEPVVERAQTVKRPSSEGLLRLTDDALSAVGLTLADLDLIAVATGPGSFNGIRGGIATAEGLALALGIPAVGVPTLDALAYPHAGRAPLLRAVLPAGRGEVYTARYEGTWADVRVVSDYTVAPPAAALEDLPPGSLLCGRIPAEVAALAERRGVSCAPSLALSATTAAVAVLALRRMDATGERQGGASVADGAGQAEPGIRPLYVRRPGITRPAGRAGIMTQASERQADEIVLQEQERERERERQEGQAGGDPAAGRSGAR